MMGAAGASASFDPAQIAAIGGCAQQHGTVYLNASAPPRSLRLDPVAAARRSNWPASSPDPSPRCGWTKAPARSARRSRGRSAATTRWRSLTGSRPFARFAGPQIKKFAAHRSRRATQATRRIDLVSSFMASLLLGGAAPLEPGDAAGMNLMDIRTRRWNPAALDATAPTSARGCPAIEVRQRTYRRAGAATGGSATDCRRRCSSPGLATTPRRSSAPASYARETSASRSARATRCSDRSRRRRHNPGGANVFGSPAGGYMLLVCFRNGSLAREHIRDRYGLGLDGILPRAVGHAARRRRRHHAAVGGGGDHADGRLRRASADSTCRLTTGRPTCARSSKGR